jgi:hypothetical protein
MSPYVHTGDTVDREQNAAVKGRVWRASLADLHGAGFRVELRVADTVVHKRRRAARGGCAGCLDRRAHLDI